MTMHHRKFRTKLCKNFVVGKCNYGDQCSFIHPPLVFSPHQPWSPFARQMGPNMDPLASQYAVLPGQFPGAYTQHSSVIDEGSSPSSLLSASDGIVSGSGDHLGWGVDKKKYPCRHFVRTGGWCPVGDNCKFIHDYSAIKPKDNTSSVIPHHTDVKEERYTSGGFHIDVSNEHVGLNGQGYQYASGPISYPCHPTVSGVCWPMQPHVPHPGLPHTLYAPAFPGGTSPQNNHAPFPSTTDAPHLPVGTCQVGGTTYFPVARPPLFGFDRAVPPPDHNSYSWRNFYQATGDVYGQPSSHIGTAFSTHRPLVETSPNQHASNAATTQVPEVDSTRTHTDESEFPYRPPKNQRVGHVRRISVAIKTDSFNQ